MLLPRAFFFFFFFNDTATTEIYTLSLHDALPILRWEREEKHCSVGDQESADRSNEIWERTPRKGAPVHRSEEHTSELQSQSNLVCRLLLEKKKKRKHSFAPPYCKNGHPTRPQS